MVSGQASNQTGAAAVTVHSDRCDLLTDRVAWTGSQDGGDDRMESTDGRSDLRDSTQNSKVHTLNLKTTMVNLINCCDRRKGRRAKGWLVL